MERRFCDVPSMVVMLNSARRLKNKLKDRVKKTRQRQAKRYAVALRSSEIAMGDQSRGAVAAGSGRGPRGQPDQLPGADRQIASGHSRIAGAIAPAAQDRPLPLARGVSGSSVAERAHGADKRSLRDPLRGGQSAPLQKAALRACRFSPGNDPHRRRRQSLSVRCLARVAGVRGQPANGHLRARPVHADPRRGNFALHGLEGHAIIRAELHDLPGGGGGSSFILRDR